MADNITLPGSGAVVATDEVGSDHFQRVKLVASGAGETEPYGDTDKGAARAPWVDPRPLFRELSQTPVVSTTPAYTAKDAVGGLLTFAAAARESGAAVTVTAVTVVDKSQQRPNLDLVLFSASPSAPTDNSVFDPTNAELTGVKVIPINQWFDFNDNSVASHHGLSVDIVLVATDLFGALVTRSTPTFVATDDIVVTITVQPA